MNTNIIIVSINCLVYNHDKYLRECFEGFVMQRTNFAFEVLVHDDASTDSSAEIIREYTAKYPNIFKPIYQKENQYSKRVGINRKYQYPRARGKYIALCEGDDYWIDPNKLQKQVDFLEAHPDYSMCFHDVYRRVKDKITTSYEHYNSDTASSLNDIILNGGLFCPTTSIVYRRDLIAEYPQFAYNCHVGDYPLQIYLALCGKVYYFKDVMGVYRIGSIGSWTHSNNKANRDHIFIKMENEIEMLKSFDAYSNYQHTSIFNKRIDEYMFTLLIYHRDKKRIIENYDRVSNLSIKKQIQCFLIKYNMDAIIDLYEKIKNACDTQLK